MELHRRLLTDWRDYVDESPTKRGVLKVLAKIFNPLGLIISCDLLWKGLPSGSVERGYIMG